MSKHTTITRTTATTYAIKLGNGRTDGMMHLMGNVLRSKEQRGHIRTGGLLTITLGPVSYQLVTRLAVGETAVLAY